MKINKSINTIGLNQKWKKNQVAKMKDRLEKSKPIWKKMFIKK
jgi:hypothetical protein